MIEDAVEKYLKAKGLQKEILYCPESAISAEDAAAHVGCQVAQLAKTIALYLKDGSIVLVVTCGDTKIDNSAYRAVFNQRPKMIPVDQLVELTGHAIGHMCPFAIKPYVKVYLDESLKSYDIIYPGCGNGNNYVELTPKELELYAENLVGWVKLCKRD